MSTLRTVVDLLSADVDSEARLFHAVIEAFGRLGLRAAIVTRSDDSLWVTVRDATSHPVIERVEQLTGLQTRGYRYDAANVTSYRHVLTTGESCFVQDSGVILRELLPAVAVPFASVLHQFVAATASILAPLRVSGRVIGLVTASGANLAPSDVPAVEGLAAAISLGLDNIRLLRRQQVADGVQDLVGDVLRAALRGEPLVTTLDGVLDNLVASGGVAAAGIARVAAGADQAEVLGWCGESLDVKSALTAGCRAVAWRAWWERSNMAPCTRCSTETACGLRGTVLLPIADRDHLYGVLCLVPAPSSSVDALRARVQPVTDALGTLFAREALEADRKEAQARLLQAQRMEAIGLLAGGIAHDFNNLLTGIQLTANLVRSELGGANPETALDLEEIEASCDRGARLTRQLLMFSRRQVLAPRDVDVNAMVRQMERLFARLLGEDIALTVVLDPSPWLVRCDPGALEQVLMNLVVNARDAMSAAGGTLTVSVQHDPSHEAPRGSSRRAERGAWLALTVADSGVGMDEATRSRIFEPFFTSKGERGTGLGLAVVYGVVDEAGGYIEVESTLGMGSTFRVWLPRAVEEVARGALDAGASRGGGRAARVLVVEDDALLRRRLERFLTQAGHSVITFGTVTAALAWVRGHLDDFDVVLCDVVLPDGDGVALASKLRELRATRPVLLMSGYLDDKNHIQEIAQRGYPFIAKPFVPDALLARLDAVLAGVSAGPTVAGR